jgi:tRNA-modifying protein YgfZ
MSNNDAPSASETAMRQWDALVTGTATIATVRDRISAVGPDAASFLHGQLSQNIVDLGEGTSAWSLLLQPNGRLIALIRVSGVATEHIMIDVEAGIGARVHSALTRFLMRTKCTLTLTEAVPVRRIVHGSALDGSGELVSCNPWLGHDQFSAESAGSAIGESPELPAVDPAVAAAWLAVHGEPRHDMDLHESSIPSETGLVAAAVAFGKGCYVGQELVERIDSRGRIVKSLVRLRSASSFSAGDELLDDSVVVGAISSAYAHPLGGTVGFGTVKIATDRVEVSTPTQARLAVSPIIGNSL